MKTAACAKVLWWEEPAFGEGREDAATGPQRWELTEVMPACSIETRLRDLAGFLTLGTA